MSIGGSLSGITFSGLSSGIDTETMLRRLVQLESIPITRLQQQQAQLTSRLGVLNQFKGKLTALATAAGGLNSAAAFNTIRASSSNEALATVSATSSAAAGSYRLKVIQLAQAQKAASAPQVSATEPRGLNGTFMVNGKALTLEASDTLATIAQKINGAGAGAVASIINGGEGNAYLTIASSSTGVSNRLQMADLQGSALQSLGILSGAPAGREPISGGFASYAFSSSSSPLGPLMNLTPAPSGTITMNGTPIDIDLGSDSLQTIAERISASGSGATASVRTIVRNGVTTHRLELTGVSEAALGDDANILQALGILQVPARHELLVARDASYSLDDIPLTSDSNTITGVIPGATLSLLRAGESEADAATITLARDDADIVKKVREFKDAYNSVVEFIKANTSFDKETFRSGSLFGEPSVRQIEAELSNVLFSSVTSGGPLTNLTQVGFAFDQSGLLTLDEAALTNALSSDPAGVGALFRAVGTGSSSAITYVSSTNASLASATPYDVEITQVATQGSYTAALAQSSPNPSNEVLTFRGSLFGSSEYALVIRPGSTLASTVAQINSDPRLRELVAATVEDGMLKITSRRYGTTGNFSVESNLEAASDNSGIGIGFPGTSRPGVDVAGTINGEPATGSGQFLTGNSGNPRTAGLQIQYTGDTLGLVGTLAFSKGTGSLINDLIGVFTDGVNGLMTATDQSIQAQIDSIDESILRLQERLTRRETELRLRFQRMEEAITRVQGQAVRLQALNAQPPS